MSTVVGQQVRLPDNCKCGSDLARIGGGDGKFAAATLACPQCGNSRGAISEFTLHFIESVAGKFGVPAAIAIRSSAIAKACAKQDEFLKRKYTPTGKSRFDVITDNFDENAPSPSGTGEEQDSPFGAEPPPKGQSND
jgi:hypothetical protein